MTSVEAGRTEWVRGDSLKVGDRIVLDHPINSLREQVYEVTGLGAYSNDHRVGWFWNRRTMIEHRITLRLAEVWSGGDVMRFLTRDYDQRAAVGVWRCV